MKRDISVILVFFLSFGITSAQDVKLSKKESIQFLEKMIKGANYSGFIITEIDIEDSIVTCTEESETGKIKRTFSHIKWEKLFMIQKVGNSPSNCVIIDVAFADKLRHKASGVIDDREVAFEKEENSFQVAIPAGEYYKVRETFFRLSEVFKETGL